MVNKIHHHRQRNGSDRSFLEMLKVVTLLLLCLLVETKAEDGSEAGKSPGSKNVFTTIYDFVQGLYSDLASRRQSIANLLFCGNCVSDSWSAIMETVANVPELDWVYKPGQNGEGRPPGFFTALNQNGVITGFGGSIANGKPVVEFVFDQTGIVQRLNATKPDVKN